MTRQLDAVGITNLEDLATQVADSWLGPRLAGSGPPEPKATGKKGARHRRPRREGRSEEGSGQEGAGEEGSGEEGRGQEGPGKEGAGQEGSGEEGGGQEGTGRDHGHRAPTPPTGAAG